MRCKAEIAGGEGGGGGVIREDGVLEIRWGTESEKA
jgi:hypothetical protein